MLALPNRLCFVSHNSFIVLLIIGPAVMALYLQTRSGGLAELISGLFHLASETGEFAIYFLAALAYSSILPASSLAASVGSTFPSTRISVMVSFLS